VNEATFIRAAEIVNHQQLMAHEAGHAAAALLLGLKVTSVRASFHTASEIHDGNPDDPAGETCFEGTTADDREMALTVLTGPMAEGQTAYWPPRWPLSLAPLTPDERQVGEHVRALDLDQAGYDELCDQARALTETPVFKRLHGYLVRSLTEPPHTVGAAEAWHLKTIAETADMEHKYVNVADATTLAEGEMLALASTYDIDKVGDRVIPGAYAGTIQRIKAGATLPLIWGHAANGSPQNWVGKIIDAAETQDGLQVHARFDLDDSVARKAWNLVRDGSIDKLSIGYTIPAGGRRRGSDGANELTTITLHEVSLVLTPANDHARVLAVKSDDEFDGVRNDARDLMLNVMGATSTSGPKEPEVTKALDLKALERELTPITITTFAC
jgi:HK97 family phage prohead protease